MHQKDEIHAFSFQQARAKQEINNSNRVIKGVDHINNRSVHISFVCIWPETEAS